ncbi:MAG: flavodoxin [Phocaeicola dorei]|nr:flavodoxin [Phocaeicola dorei]
MAAIIIYFSRADENYFGGVRRYIETGNTEVIAGMIQKLTGADIFKIEPLHPYSAEYDSCIAEAQRDYQSKARPELVSYPESLDKYDIIYLGYPNYWGTAPMHVFTLLEKYDFSGKTIKPFCTHEGSDMGHSERDLRVACPGANIIRGLAIYGSSVYDAEKMVKSWI